MTSIRRRGIISFFESVLCFSGVFHLSTSFVSLLHGNSITTWTDLGLSLIFGFTISLIFKIKKQPVAL